MSLYYLIVICDAIILLSTLLWLAKNSSIEFQNISLSIIIGFLIISIGTVITSPEIMDVIYFSTIFGSALSLVGVFFYFIPLYFNAEKILEIRSIYLWSLIIFVNSIMVVLAIFLLMIPSVPVLMPLYFLIISFPITFLLLYIVNQDKKLGSQSESLRAVHEQKKEDINLLNVFSKPLKITEEEVSISKEKKICLMCKGKAIGMIYICTECEAFYCVKCANALSNLENACWVCNTPIDESKPTTPFKREEEEVYSSKPTIRNGSRPS